MSMSAWRHMDSLFIIHFNIGFAMAGIFRAARGPGSSHNICLSKPLSPIMKFPSRDGEQEFFSCEHFFQNISRDLMINDEIGKQFPAIDVFSMSIAALSEDLIKVSGNAVSGGIRKTDIHWVLTVPAIWNDGAKQFMREAATKHPANIATEKLSIALEPEAASIFCRHLSVENVIGSDTISKLPIGTKYMILDAGGGTIDITVHEVTSSGGLKEVHAASGGGWGGILVDEAFKNLLMEIVGTEVYQTFVKQETDDWIDVWRTFEVKKKILDPTMTGKVNMKLPLSLMDLCKAETGQDLRDRIAQSRYASHVQLNGDKVRFDSSVLQGLFRSSIETTVNHVKSVLRDESARGIKVILMVGGFSDSPMLQAAIKKEFSNLKIVIPKEASSAILRGAVIFGHNPGAISQRVLRKTYGIEVKGDFIKGIHDEKYKTETTRGIRCDKSFHKHVEIGQAVVVGSTQTQKSYWPSERNQKSISFLIFASNLKEPKYTDQGCQYLGNLEIDISDVPGDLDREVLASLTFSDTEIKAEARVKQTNKIVTTTVNFLG